jgi:hypothetical protein
MEPQADRGTGEPRVPPPTPNLRLVAPDEPADAPPPVPVWHRRLRPPGHHPRPHARPRES